MLIEVELYQIILTEGSPTQVIVLKEKVGERLFPIFIGFHEAMAIDRKIKETPAPRPMSHDLMFNIIEQMGGHITRIIINDLQNETFFSIVEVERDGEKIELDSRPSDAMALAVRSDAPVFVDEEVLERASQHRMGT